MTVSVAKKLLEERSGAAIVETLFVFPTFFAFFSVIVQLCYLEVAALGTQHAAIVAARAAIVVAGDDPQHYGNSDVGTLDGQRRTEVEEAAKNALRIASVDPEVELEFSGGFDQGSVVKVTARFEYPCAVPVGNTIVCGVRKKTQITREASMPVQTAGYEYP